MKKYLNKIFKNRYVHNFYKILCRSEMRVLPGTIAYFLIMSIVPAILIIAVICSKFSISLLSIIKILTEIIPNDVSNLLIPIVSGVQENSFSLLYIFIGILLASNGTHSMILASNTLYGIDNNNYIRRRIKAIFMTLVLMSLFMFVLVVLAFGNIIIKFFLGLKIFIDVADIIYSVFIILKWPLAILIIFLLIKAVYMLAPDHRVPSKYVNKGAIFTTIGWVILTAIFSYYANNIANYDLLYGSLSSLVVMMIWIYVMAYILVIGIAINTNIYKVEKENLN